MIKQLVEVEIKLEIDYRECKREHCGSCHYSYSVNPGWSGPKGGARVRCRMIEMEALKRTEEKCCSKLIVSPFILVDRDGTCKEFCLTV